MKSSITIDLLYDGNCRFVMRTIQFLKRLDRRNRIHLTNTAARKFDAASFDKSQGELTAEIYARLADGTWLKGLDAFRELSSAVGLAPLVLVTRLPLIRPALNVGYGLFAKSLLKNRRPASQRAGARAIVTTSSSGSVIQTSS